MDTTLADRIDADEVVALTRRLVQFDTTNPPGNEGPASHFLGDYLSGAGIAVEYQEVEPGRPNLIARLRGQGESGHLVFSGHMDVVPAGDLSLWEHNPFAADLVDGRIVGRGAADMKGGVAAMAVALKTLARSGFFPRADLILAVSMSEERDLAPGARHMAQTAVLAGSARLVIGEPTRLDVCTAQKGGMGWQITAHGRAAHTSTPHLGVSAISYMARVVPVVEANPFPYERHEVLGEPTVSVVSIEGRGAAFNIIPE